jgi:pilus assembly protein CpaB
MKLNLNLPRGTIFLIAAVAAGLVATFGIHRYVSVKTRVVGVPTRQVFIATVDISPGTAISGQAVKAEPRPQEFIPPNSAATMREIEGRVVKAPIYKGNPILLSMLAPEGTAAGLSGILEDGKRALTVKVDEVAGVAGFIHPGDRVDVLVDLSLKGQSEHFSKTILHNISVLSTGQVWEQKGENKPMVVSTVTLELTPEEGEVLNLASNEGKIRLALRNRNNKTVANTRGVTTSILVNGAGAKKEEKVAVQTARDEKSIEVIKGLDRSDAKI